MQAVSCTPHMLPAALAPHTKREYYKRWARLRSYFHRDAASGAKPVTIAYGSNQQTAGGAPMVTSEFESMLATNWR